MIAEISEPKSTSWPRTLKPSPFAPPPPAALTSGVMMLPVNALTSVLNASAIDSPTATTTSWPCIRKFLNPLNTVAPFSSRRCADDTTAATRGRRGPSVLEKVAALLELLVLARVLVPLRAAHGEIRTGEHRRQRGEKHAVGLERVQRLLLGR